MVKIVLETGVLDVSEKTNFPITFNIGDITNIMSKRTMEKIDHHGDL